MITVTDPNLDEVMDVLADHHRRQAIRILRQTPDRAVAFEELLDELMRKTGEDENRRDHLAIQLHHQHLPKLAGEDLIAYERDARRIRYRPNQRIEAVMDDISSPQSRPVSDD